MKTIARTLMAAALLAAAAAPCGAQTPQGTAFTYQGRLTDGAAPATGTYDFQFVLYDAAVGGAQVGPIVLRDDVAVAGGLFTVRLDFGPAFAGSRRWLDIGVRPGTATGTYTVVSPRQELTAAPAALYAATAATVAGLSCGDGQVAKWTGGWTCGPDANAGGTVTSVGTGAGLSGGPIVGSGSVAVAVGGITTELIGEAAVTSSKIAPGAVGLAQIDPTQVQPRVAGACPLGEYLRGVNPDGSVLCTGLPTAPTITTVDSGPNSLGTYPSIAVPAEGLPVVSYREETNGVLKVARCGNPSCTAGTVVTVVDASPIGAPLGTYTSLALGADGLPVISYRGQNATLKVAKCGNPACTAGNSIVTVDDPADGSTVGSFTSIAVPADGRPVISYLDLTAMTLKVAKCGDPACSAGNVATTVDDPPGGNLIGGYTSLALGADGLPVVSYHDQTSGALKVAHCGDPACTAGNTLSTVDDPANATVGTHTSIAVGADGLPVISYRDQSAGALKVAHCDDVACTTATLTTVDGPPAAGSFTSIEVPADGRPVISSAGPGTLRVVKCADAACTAATVTTVDGPSPTSVGYTALALGADGLPVVAYRDDTGRSLKVVKCGNAACR
jgi:hypothetical protein